MTAHTQDRNTQPGTVYRIIVRGVLEASWSERVAGMKIVPVEDTGGLEKRTLLVGPVRDQAQLTGVLNTLYGLHCSLLSVEILEQGELLEESASQETQHES